VRAARFGGGGPPEVLRIDTMAWPFLMRDEVLIRVAASRLNGTDVRIRAGGLCLIGSVQLPFTPGFDASGEVVDLGPKVTAFRPGDQVYAPLGRRGGGAADYVPLSTRLMALQALRRHAQVRPGQRVLVYGAAVSGLSRWDSPGSSGRTSRG